MYKMIIEYEMIADQLERRFREVKDEIKTERNVNKLHSLERRADLLQTERYEVLRDITDMKAHLSDLEIEQWQDRKELA